MVDDGISDLFKRYDPGDLSDLTRVDKDLTSLPKDEIRGETDDLFEVPDGLTKLSSEDVIDGVDYEEDEMPGTPPQITPQSVYRQLPQPTYRVVRRIPPPPNIRGMKQ